MRSTVCCISLTLLFHAPLHAQQNSTAKQQVLQLNQVTGEKLVKERIRRIAANPAEAKKLIEAGRSLLRADKGALRYNAAYILAEVSAKLDNIDAAKLFYRTCGRQAVELQSTSKLLESYGGLIELLYNKKKYDESARICRELLELKTDDGKPRVVLRAVTTRLGDAGYVEDDSFNTAKRLQFGVHRLLVQAIAKQGKFDQAIRLVEDLIKARGHWLNYELKGWVYREAGKHEKAAQTYEEVIDKVQKDSTLDKDEKGSYIDDYRYILSNIYVSMDKIKQATEQLEQLLQRNPDDPGYANDLGYIYADHDLKLDRAEKLIRKAIRLDVARRKKNPNLSAKEKMRANGAYLDSLGWVLYKKKKFEEAKKYLLMAVEDEASQHIEIYDHLGDVYIALGQIDKALEAWRKGIKVAGKGSREQEIRRSVEKKIAKYSK